MPSWNSLTFKGSVFFLLLLWFPHSIQWDWCSYLHLADFLMGFMLANIPYMTWILWFLAFKCTFPICHVRQKTYNRSPCLYPPRPSKVVKFHFYFWWVFRGTNFTPCLGKSVILPIQDPMVLSPNTDVCCSPSWWVEKNGMIPCGRLMMSYERMNLSWFCVPVVFRCLLIRICIFTSFCKTYSNLIYKSSTYTTFIHARLSGVSCVWGSLSQPLRLRAD